MAQPSDRMYRVLFKIEQHLDPSDGFDREDPAVATVPRTVAALERRGLIWWNPASKRYEITESGESEIDYRRAVIG